VDRTDLGYSYSAQPPSPVPPEVVQVARDLASPNSSLRSRAAWRLLKPGMLDHAISCEETRRALLTNDIPVAAATIGEIELCASILQQVPRLRSDSDIRVRLAATEANHLIEVWKAIESGKVEQPYIAGVPVQSISVLQVYLDIKSHWVRPTARLLKYVWGAIAGGLSSLRSSRS